MRNTTDSLNSQISDLYKLNYVFESTSSSEFFENLNEVSIQNSYQELFDFDFENQEDPRVVAIQNIYDAFDAIDKNQNTLARKTNPTEFFDQVIERITAHSNDTPKINGQVLKQVRSLIQLQIRNLHQQLTLASTPETNLHQPSRFEPFIPYVRPAAAMFVGSAMLVSSLALEFSAQFALLVGANVAPVVIAGLAIAGGLLAIHGVYSAIRTYYPAATEETAPRSLRERAAEFGQKFVTPALVTGAVTGTIIAAFALTLYLNAQLATQAALLVGLTTITPAMLITLGTVGTVMALASLYGLYCQYKPVAPKDETVATVGDATTPAQSYYQRASSFANNCMGYFNKTPQNPTTTQAPVVSVETENPTASNDADTPTPGCFEGFKKTCMSYMGK